MSDMLSQAEIDALLSGSSSTDDYNEFDTEKDEGLLVQERDALGEIGNISMGTAATTLYNLLGQKVVITIPKVEVMDWDSLISTYEDTHVAVRIEYVAGLKGSNLLILKEDDTKVITDLMMGGDGTNVSGTLNDLHLSAISEAMNQMIGSASTSMSEMFSKKINISPPKSYIASFGDEDWIQEYAGEKIVKVMFNMIVGDIINSEFMQIMPLSFAKELVGNLLDTSEEVVGELSKPAQTGQAPYQNHDLRNDMVNEKIMAHIPAEDEYEYSINSRTPVGRNINVQPAQFKDFGDEVIAVEKKNISLIMDVPLEVTVELGRTKKMIKDILEMGPGSIIELDKLAGEPVDILVNGKKIAKGEVVVIDESFGVRITDIAHPSKRL